MFKNRLMIALLMFYTIDVFAQESAEKSKLDCDSKESEHMALQKNILGLKHKDNPLSFYQSNHDSALAELIMLKGLKELKERHKNFLRNITEENGIEDFGKLNKVRNQLKDGIDVMGKMIVMQDMIDQIIGLENEPSSEPNHQLKNMARNDPKEFINLLKSRCLDKTPTERAFKYKLCAAITDIPNSDKAWKDLDEPQKKAIKAQYQNLETYSPSIKKMVEGFAKAYLVRHDKAITDDQAKEQRIKELENYKKLLRDGLPKEFSPESLLQDSTDLHQALVSSTKESNSPTNENLDQIKEMKKLTYKIDKGMEKYKKCLGKLRFRELTSPDPEAPGCELKIPQYRCQGPDHSNCTEIPSKEITFERAQEKIKDYQLKMTSDIKEGINKYTNMAGADNESIEIPEGTFDLLDQKAQSLSLEQNKKTKIEETAKESGKNDKKYLDKHFEKLECSLMLFNDRAKMMSEIYDSGEPSKSMDTKKIFLKGLKNSGCLDQGYDLNHELGLINASKEVFSKNTGYEMNHDFLESCIQKQPDAVKLEGRIRELEDEVMAAKGSIAKIKEKKDYKNLFELKVLSLQRYKIKCIYSRKRHPCHLDFTENSGNNKLDSFISHNNKVIGILEENELKSTPSYAPDLRQHTKRMADACTDKRREKYPKLCLDAKNRHTNAMMKTENEKVRDSHEKYHITYGPDGTKEIRKKAKVSSMVVSSLGRGIVEYGVPTWMQYESNKAQMNYNEAMGYNKKVNNYMMDNGYFWGGGYGGYGYAGGIYPFSTFNNGYYSPFLSSGYQAGGYRSQYLSIQ